MQSDELCSFDSISILFLFRVKLDTFLSALLKIILLISPEFLVYFQSKADENRSYMVARLANHAYQ